MRRLTEEQKMRIVRRIKDTLKMLRVDVRFDEFDLIITVKKFLMVEMISYNDIKKLVRYLRRYGYKLSCFKLYENKLEIIFTSFTSIA